MALATGIEFFLADRAIPYAEEIGTHFVIDRRRLARYVAWIENRPWPGSASWSDCRATGHHPDTPPWLSRWLVIMVDNVLHVLISGTAIYYIG